MAKHAHSFTEAHEMETLKENSWYIRGCKKLEKYFQNNKIDLNGFYKSVAYYIKDGKWECSIIDNLPHRTEITLQDYLESLKPQSFDELDLEFEEKERSSIEFLKSRGYSVCKKPKLTLAELAEKAGLDINNIEIIK